MSKYNTHRLISFSLALAAVFAATALFYGFRAEKYERHIIQSSESALSTLISSAEAMQDGIKTIGYSTGGISLASAAAEVWSASQSAKAALSALSLSESGMPQYEKLLNQAGEYSLSLMLNVSDGGSVSQAELDSLSNMSSSLSAFCSSLSSLKEQIDIGELSMGGIIPAGKITLLSDEMDKLEKAFTPDSSLVYDGNYSDHISEITPLYTHGMEEASQEKALKTAAKFLGVNPDSMDLIYQSDGVIPVYGFGIDDTVIEVTKSGGIVLTISDSRTVRSSVISENEARQIALQTAEELGFTGLKCRYSSVKNNILTAELVSVSNNVTVYPDRITVRVAMDNGSIVGFDSRRYLMSNTERSTTIPETIPEGAALALIPTNGQNERLCYEYLRDGHLEYVCCESGLCYAVHAFSENEQDGFISY